IENRIGKKGITYRVQVIIKNEAAIVHRESQSFPQRRSADSWGAKRNKELQKALDDGGVEELTALVTPPPESPTLGKLILDYRERFAATYGRTVSADLIQLSKSDTATKRIDQLVSSDFVDHVQTRKDGVRNKHGDFVVKPVSAATAANDLIRFSSVLKAGRS